MFVREKVTFQNDKEYRYLQLVHNYREGNKVKQKVLLTLGRADKLNRQWVDQVVGALKDYTQKAKVLESVESIQPKEALNMGDVVVLSHLWQQVGLDGIIKRLLRERKHEFDVQTSLKAQVFNRLIDPKSELSTYEWLKKDIYFPEGDSLELHHLYRSIDFLISEKESIENQLAYNLLDLFSMDLDVVFYDTTLVSYHGEGEGELISYSRKKERQFLVGLMLSRDGFPIASEVMPGNTTDVTTVKGVVDQLSNRFSVGRCIFVCDRGMVSEDNLKYLKSEGLDYVVGIPARRYKQVREEVLSTPGRYQEIKENLHIKETFLGEKRYIICYNPKEAKRNKHQRESIILELEKEIENLDPKTKKAHKLLCHSVKSKYLRQLKDGTMRIDRSAVADEERHDGKYVLLSSDMELTSQEIATTYRKLKRIEQSFRSMKSLEEVAPVYHQVDRRIKGHVFICVLSHLLENALSKRLSNDGIEITPAKAIKELGRLKAVKIEVNGEPYLFRTSASEQVKQIFKALHIRLPSKVKKL